jgi:arsenate reductase (glutaredoxin)
MAEFTYYHNPKCSKSRAGMVALEEKEVVLTVKEYINEGLSKGEIYALKSKLDKPVTDFVRKGDAKNLGIDISALSEDQLVDEIVANPILLERPILSSVSKASIGRPTEDLFDVL